MKTYLKAFVLCISTQCWAQTPGSLDSSFGNGGKVLTTVNSVSKAQGVALQPDGKIVIAGVTETSSTTSFLCIRYNPDGSLDSTFGTNGIVTTSFNPTTYDRGGCIAIQPDWKILVGGSSNGRAAIMRYNTDGSLDGTFGNGGKVVTNLWVQNDMMNIKINPSDQSIFLSLKWGIAKFSANGTLDNTFNTVVPSSNAGSNYQYEFRDFLLHPNGKISAAGICWIAYGVGWTKDDFVYRVNSNSTMDTSFSGDGIEVYTNPLSQESYTYNETYSILLKPNNSIVLAGYSGYSSYNFKLFEVNQSGIQTNSLLISFGSPGNGICYGLKEDYQSKYIMVGSVGTSANSSFAIAAVTPTYQLDTTFGTVGKVTTTFGDNTTNQAYAVAIQEDNKIIAVGYSGNSVALARYNGTAGLGTNDWNQMSIGIVYPCPATNELTFELKNNDFVNEEYQLSDLNGRIITKGIINGTTTTINTEMLLKGMYFLKITNKDFIAKFIKQ